MLVRELVLCLKHIILVRKADGDNNVVIEHRVDFNSPEQKGLKMSIIKRARSAVNGRFVPMRVAQKRPKTHVVETIKRK